MRESERWATGAGIYVGWLVAEQGGKGERAKMQNHRSWNKFEGEFA